MQCPRAEVVPGHVNHRRTLSFFPMEAQGNKPLQYFAELGAEVSRRWSRFGRNAASLPFAGEAALEAIDVPLELNALEVSPEVG